MKKLFLLILVALVGFALNANAQDQYMVSVPVYVWKVYKNGNGAEVKTVQAEIFTKQYGVYSASSEQDAIYQIYDMANSDYPCKNEKYSHSEKLNGEICQVYYRYCASVPDATATRQ